MGGGEGKVGGMGKVAGEGNLLEAHETEPKRLVHAPSDPDRITLLGKVQVLRVTYHNPFS